MEISKVVINGFKIYECLELDITNINNVLVGNNGAGKTTFLEAINLALTGKIAGNPLGKVLSPNIFNMNIRRRYLAELKASIGHSTKPQTPSIVIEVYFKDQDNLARYSGQNNTLNMSAPGMQLCVEFDTQYSQDYLQRLNIMELKEEDAPDTKENYPAIEDVPVEYYRIQRHYFNSDPVIQRTNPFKVFFVDGTKKDYSNYVGKFIYSNVCQLIDNHDSTRIQSIYEDIRRKLKNHPILNKFNADNEDSLTISGKKVRFSVKESLPDEWLQELTVDVDSVPFDDIGFGAQKVIQMELAVSRFQNQEGILLFEEPENNLSFANMSRLISMIEDNDTKQKFISTHSSFVANKIGLEDLLLCEHGHISPFADLDTENIKYFQKLPGYNTLRLLLGNKVVLVEGPTDELLFERAYLDIYQKLPIENGVDVLVVDSLAFKRYLDIARAIHKKVWVLTDNDGDIEKIKTKYDGYLYDPFLKFWYEKDEGLHTIEPSVLAANGEIAELQKFAAIVHPETWRPAPADDDDLKKKLENFMTENKSEWALRVFLAANSIKYPTYITEAIEDVEK